MRIFYGVLSTLFSEVLYMKKNLFSDKHKGSKGFYAALGISAIMIGASCYYAYDQGEKLSQDFLSQNIITEENEAVNRRVTGLPKATLPPVRHTTAVTTVYPTLTAGIAAPPPSATVPAAAIEVIPQRQAAEEAAAVTPPELNGMVTRMENVKAPLSDMSGVINGFSGSELVKNETTGSWQTHNGVDLSADVGSEVYAVSNGCVTAVENDPLWGVTVVIDHNNGFITRYCSLADDLSVQKGDMVTSGDLLGVIGNTADIESSEPSHLHFEVMHNGRYVDPVDAVGEH